MGHYQNETTFSDELIAFLFSYRSNSIRKKILWELVQKRRKISNNTYNQNMYRLKKRGIIQDKNEMFCLSNKGKTLYTNPYRKIKKNLIKTNKVLIIFDIPEKKKKVREWIRNQIKDWDFKMIQKSVWIGYGPLPEEFFKRLKILKVDNGVKIYNLQKKL
jgi:DNA-binding transcriptional regulator PaaX